MTSGENIPDRQAITFQLDPISDRLLVELGRKAGKLMYSLADHPTEFSLDSFGPITKKLTKINTSVESHLRGQSFGLNIREDETGLTIASLSVPDESEQARTLRQYTRWADARSGRSTEGYEARALRLSLNGEDSEAFRQAAESEFIASLSVRCLGIRAKDIRPFGRDNLQILDGGVE